MSNDPCGSVDAQVSDMRHSAAMAGRGEEGRRFTTDMTLDTLLLGDSRFRRGVLYSVGLAAVWLLAAAVRPEVTYHLAPALVAGALPVTIVLDRGNSRGARVVGAAAAIGFAIAVVTALLLAAAGWLEGPTIGRFTSGLSESVAGAAFGAVAGLLVTAVWRR